MISLPPADRKHIYRRLWQPLQIGPCMLVLILPTPGGWKAEWTLAGKKVAQIFNPRPGRESNRGPQDWEAEILNTAPTPPLDSCFYICFHRLSYCILRFWITIQAQWNQYERFKIIRTVYTRVQVLRVYKSNPIFEAKNTTFLEKVWFFSFHQLNKINRWSGIQG